MRAMRGGHVLAHGEEPLSTVATCMAGHPSATMDDLDDVGGGTHLDLSGLPGGPLVASDRQWLQRSAFELLEQVAAGDGLATKASVVDQRELLGDGRVQLGQRKELPFAQGRQHPAFGDLHTIDRGTRAALHCPIYRDLLLCIGDAVTAVCGGCRV